MDDFQLLFNSDVILGKNIIVIRLLEMCIRHVTMPILVLKCYRRSKYGFQIQFAMFFKLVLHDFSKIQLSIGVKSCPFKLCQKYKIQ